MAFTHSLPAITYGREQTYTIEADLMGRTLVFKNKEDQMVAFAQKSTKALITSQVQLPLFRLAPISTACFYNYTRVHLCGLVASWSAYMLPALHILCSY